MVDFDGAAKRKFSLLARIFAFGIVDLPVAI